MDSFAPVLALQNLINLFSEQKGSLEKEYDVVVFDGMSSEETLRLIGATERARYRNMCCIVYIICYILPCFLFYDAISYELFFVSLLTGHT